MMATAINTEESGRKDAFCCGAESAVGTKRTWRDVRLMAAFGGKADMGSVIISFDD
jgi:hypothetical protein